MPVRVGAAREAQSLWFKEFNSKKAAEQMWHIESPNSFDLRDMLLHSFRYAFRNTADLLSLVDQIAEGNSCEDMI